VFVVSVDTFRLTWRHDKDVRIPAAIPLRFHLSTVEGNQLNNAAAIRGKSGASSNAGQFWDELPVISQSN